MNMDTYSDNRGSRSSKDINSHFKGLSYHVLEEDETHDATSSGEHVLVA
jgi:hypothetical protein